jgi:RNA polymerase sigma-70 factor, ECF subfamily
VSAQTTTTNQNDEEVLLVRNAQKNPEAFRPLYEKYFKRIYLFVLHRVGDKQLTADITSQVFLKALMNIGKYTFRGVPFSAWLFRVALNECYDFLRKSNRYRFVALDESGVEHLHEELTAETAQHDLQQKLPSILEKLSVDELHLLELRFFERRPFSEVADILGITETYAKVKVYRLLDKMKKLFVETKEP